MSHSKETTAMSLHSYVTQCNACATYKTEEIGGCIIRHKTLRYSDTTIHFVEGGDVAGELVMLIHGFPNFWFLWIYQLQALAEAGFHVICPDLRGYNKSSKPIGVDFYGAAHLISDMIQLIDFCGKGQMVTMVGHDWGGTVTWAFAEAYPSRLKKIIVVNSPHVASFRIALDSSLRQCIRSWYFLFFQLPIIPEAFLRFNRFWALRAIIKRSRSAEMIKRHLEAYDSMGTATGMLNYYRAAHAGHWSIVGKTQVTLPVTVIWGERDDCLDIKLSDPPKDLVPNAEVVVLPQLSHWPMWDNPELFNKTLLNSLV